MYKYGETTNEPNQCMQGYLVGNGVTHSKFDGLNALLPFAQGMGLISNDLFEVGEAHLSHRLSA